MLIVSAVLVGCLNGETAITTDTESSSAATGSTTGTDGPAGTSTGSSSGEPTEASTFIPTTGEPSTGEPSTGVESTGVDSTGTPAAVCGDSIVEAPEACDDGDADNGDYCSDTCQLASCGDGYTRAGIEDCDDANPDNTDACLNDCSAASCGDGFVQAGVETCDDGDADDTDDCPGSCAPAVCGDGFVQAGVEACDDGNPINADACSNKCVPTPQALLLDPGALTMQYGDTQLGTAFLDSCPAGQVLIGFSGVLKNDSHAALKGLCGTPTLAVQADTFVIKVGPGAPLSERGGAGDTPWMRSCQANTVVSGFSGRAGLGVNQLTLSCAPLVVSEAIDGSFSVALGLASPLPAIGGPGGLPFLQTDCPAGQVGAAQNLRANATITAFGLGCAAVSLTY